MHSHTLTYTKQQTTMALFALFAQAICCMKMKQHAVMDGCLAWDRP